MAETFTLYGENGSGSFTAEALLAEAGAKLRMARVTLAAPGEETAMDVKVNPLRRVPALVMPDGDVVTESAAIVLALVDAFPDLALAPPPGSAARRSFYRWLMFISNNCYEATGRYDYPERFTADPAGVEGVRNAARESARKFWLMVESSLAFAPWTLGERFSALDVYVANLSRWTVGKEWRLENLPRIEALAKAVAARPKIAPIWQRHFGKG